MSKKAQVEIREMLLTIIIAGILFIVGLLIFANISNVTQSILDPDVSTQRNETVTNITMIDGSDNSTLLTQDRFILNSESIRNSTNGDSLLVRDLDYNIVLTGTSGAVGTKANFTLLHPGHNNTEFKATYDFNTESAAQTSTNNLETTVLDSFSLGVIALIVLDAIK